MANNIIFSKVEQIDSLELMEFLYDQSNDKTEKSKKSISIPENECLAITDQVVAALKKLGEDLNKNRYQEIEIKILPIVEPNWDTFFYENLLCKLFEKQGIFLKYKTITETVNSSKTTVQRVYKCSIDEKLNILSNFFLQLIEAKKENNEELFKKCQTDHFLREDLMENLNCSIILETFQFTDLKILKEQISLIKDNSQLIPQIYKTALKVMSKNTTFLKDIQSLDEESLQFSKKVIESNKEHKVLDQKLSTHLLENISNNLDLLEFGPFVNSEDMITF